LKSNGILTHKRMNRNWLEMVFPAALGLLVVTIGVLLLSLTGVLYEEPLSANNWVCAGPMSADRSQTALTAADMPLPPGTDPAAVAIGDALFKGNCAQCHAVNDVVVGPALAGVRKRRPEKWLLAWVKNSSKMVASGDEYAVQLFNQYQKQQMPSFQLSDNEIRQILLYVRSQESVVSGPAGAVAATP
jgi:mono/diheme cytochrome c family protein